MSDYVEAIQVGIYQKVWPSLQNEHGQETAKRLAAAVANMLVGKSGKHTREELLKAERIAQDLVKNDQEIRHAAVMAVRTMMVVEGQTKGFEVVRPMMDLVVWMGQLGDIPSEAPTPEQMEKLASDFYAKYGPKP